MSTWCSVLCNVDCIIWFYFHSVPYVKYFLQATWRQSFYFMRSNGSQNLKKKKKGFLHVPTEQRLLCCLRKSVCINHAMRPHWITLDCHKSSFSRKLFPKSVCYIWIGSAFSAESLALCELVSKSSATVLSVLNALLSTPSLDICNWKIGNFMLCLILLHADGTPKAKDDGGTALKIRKRIHRKFDLKLIVEQMDMIDCTWRCPQTNFTQKTIHTFLHTTGQTLLDSD